MSRKTVVSEKAPRAIGPYAHAVWTGNLLYCSEQAAVDPQAGALIQGGITEQTQQTFDNIEHVLHAAGLGFEDVVKVNVYLTSMSNFAAMNAVYQQRFTAPFPARTTVAVAELPLNALVEIEVIAEKRE